MVERHDPEGSISEAVPVLDHLREPAGPLGAVRTRHAFRPARRPGRVEHHGGLALVTVDGAGVLGAGERFDVGVLLEEQPSARVGDAVLDIVARDSVRERYEDGAEPLAGPEEDHGLATIRDDRGDPVTLIDTLRGETAGDPRRQAVKVGVGQSRVAVDERLGARGALGGVEQGEREVHRPRSAVRAIASTIGS